MKYLLLVLLVSYVSGDRVIQTNSGPIRGTSLETKNVDAFLGIPYAEPPVGKLRFARPVPKSPWTETFDAKKFPVACVQCMMEEMSKMFNQSKEMSEDCLYLNVWVPRTETNLKPIMVFIHGGGFMIGSSNIPVYGGANLAEHGDVIVASMNYRLGTLGFFSAFIDEAAGSMGMYDQVLALKWIKDNAKHFGGDPDNIVIFGESAGSWSVSMHMVSPLSKNLFRRAILQSGSTVAPTYSKDNAAVRTASLLISKHVGCATSDEDLKENPRKVVECMKNLPVEKFIEIDENLFKKLAFLIPRVGDEFLPETPTDLLRKAESKDTEVLAGITRDEGSMFVAFQAGFETGDIFGESIDEKSFNEAVARKMFEPLMKNELYAKIIEKYFQRVEKEFRYTYLNAVSDIMGDSLITCSTVFYADFQALKKHPVYFYLFDYRSPSSKYPEWAGVPHFEEIPYVFGNSLLHPFSENEKQLSKDVMDFWTAFAKTGNPNIPGRLEWPKYNYGDPKYMIISMSDRLGVKPDNYRCEEWRNLYRSTIDEEVIQNYKNPTTEL